MLCASCASVIDGGKQQLAFDSNEKDVDIYVNGAFLCRTPCLKEVRRANKRLMITAQKEGFVERSMFLDKNLNVTTVFNFLSFSTSTFGFSTDLTTGGIWEYHPNSIYVVMNKEPKTAGEKEKLQEQNKIRDFVLRNFDALERDAYDERTVGEYLKTLSQMTKLKEIEIRSVFQNAYTAPDCAERIVGLTLSK